MIPLELEGCAKDRPTHRNVQPQNISLIVDVEMPVARPKCQPVGCAIIERAKELDGELRAGADIARLVVRFDNAIRADHRSSDRGQPDMPPK